MTETFLSLQEVAEKFNLKKTTVWTWVQQKRIKASKVGKSWRVKESDLIDFINAGSNDR
jgi:excisionase family DNA binding protein